MPCGDTYYCWSTVEPMFLLHSMNGRTNDLLLLSFIAQEVGEP